MADQLLTMGATSSIRLRLTLTSSAHPAVGSITASIIQGVRI